MSAPLMVRRCTSCLWPLTFAALGALVGCGGQTTPTSSGCETTSADALVTLDDDAATDLLASALTGGDCDEIAVYADDGTVSQAAFDLDQGGRVVAEYDDEGRVVAIRDGDTTVGAAYNDAFSTARLTIDSSGTSEATVVSVARDTENNAERAVTQNGTELTFCAQLGQLADLIAAACDSDPTLALCSGDIANSAQAAQKVCGGGMVQELDNLGGTILGNAQQNFAATCLPFATIRDAEGTALTIIVSTVTAGFVGLPTVDCSVTEQPDSAIDEVTVLPGGTCVIDITGADTGFYEILTECSDAGGSSASGSVSFDLGGAQGAFFGARISCDSDNPQVGSAITCQATIQNGPDSDGAVDPAQAGSGSDFFWDFGDGSFAKGQLATHTYAQEGTFTIALQAVSLAGDFTDAQTIVVGEGSDVGGPSDVFEGDIRIEILADDELTNPGGVINLSVAAEEALEPIEHYWQILHSETLDGEFDADVATLSDPFTPSAQVQGLREGVVVVGVEIFDALGQYGFDFTILSFCEDSCLAALIKPGFAEVGVPFVPELFVVGTADSDTLSYSWFVDFAEQGNTVNFSDERARAPQVIVAQPGFVALAVEVSDTAGSSAVAYGAFDVFVEGFDELFAEFLGPFAGPVGTAFPLYSFIQGGVPPYFCAWQINGAGGAGPDAQILDPFACFESQILFSEPGCVAVDLVVEDVTGALGFSAFEICAFDEFAFDCPFDGFCDEACLSQGLFDPDCDDPCPFDGFCEEECPIFDPDCFEDFEFCLAGDFICDHFCEIELGTPDSDCDACIEDGVCIEFCPAGDPDCGYQLCDPSDGICDPICEPPDPDCLDYCVPNDGICDPCVPPDVDCGQTNDEICSETGFLCCVGDGFCDGPCPEPDQDCANCGFADGVCILGCFDAPDPDCAAGFCGDSICDSGLGEDELSCPLDCGGGFCGDFVCAPALGEDPASCPEDCLNGSGFCGDQICDPVLGENPTSCPQDCQNGIDFCGDQFCDPTIGENEFNCPEDCPPGSGFCGDLICDPALGENSSTCPGDCPTGVESCDPDGSCNPDCIPPFGGAATDPDCTNDDHCAVAGYCCPADEYCDKDCPDPDPQCSQGISPCGNLVIESGEDCDPPDDVTCDGNCQIIESECTTDAECDDGNMCTEDFCAVTNGICAHVPIIDCCVVDADCPGTDICLDQVCRISDCAADGVCSFICLVSEAFDVDPDCSNADVCAQLNSCCAGDGFCDPLGCPEPDPDCNP